MFKDRLTKMSEVFRLRRKGAVVIPVAVALILLASGVLTAPHQAFSVSAVSTLQPYAEKHPAQQPVGAQPAATPEQVANQPSIWPASGDVTSRFGARVSPMDGSSSEIHAGIDIASSTGTPVVATADGVVVTSGWVEGYGNLVEVDHGNGVHTLYGHNSQLNAAVGQAVRKGQVIAFAGSTGRSTGPHVHYEVRENGTAVDPTRYLIKF